MIYLDDLTKKQAAHFADQEAEIRGFTVGSAPWKTAFKRYLSFAISTMAVGRNPRSSNPRDEGAWPEVFGPEGFCAKVAKGFKGKRGESHTKREIAERVKGSVTALVYLYLNGIYGIKTTTEVHESGKIKSTDTSELQLKGPDDSMSEDEAKAQNMDVVFNQLALTVIETAVYEFLIPFFTMSPDDVAAVLDKISVEGKVSPADMAKIRDETERRVRAAMNTVIKDLKFKDLVLG